MMPLQADLMIVFSFEHDVHCKKNPMDVENITITMAPSLVNDNSET